MPAKKKRRICRTHRRRARQNLRRPGSVRSHAHRNRAGKGMAVKYRR